MYIYICYIYMYIIYIWYVYIYDIYICIYIYIYMYIIYTYIHIYDMYIYIWYIYMIYIYMIYILYILYGIYIWYMYIVDSARNGIYFCRQLRMPWTSSFKSSFSCPTCDPLTSAGDFQTCSFFWWLPFRSSNGVCLRWVSNGKSTIWWIYSVYIFLGGTRDPLSKSIVTWAFDPESIAPLLWGLSFFEEF